MTKPLVDYLIDNCGYQVIVINRTVAKAEKVVEGRSAGTAVEWLNNDPDVLDNDQIKSFKGKTYRDFIASLINETTTDDLENRVCNYLNVESNADIIHRLKWLGQFGLNNMLITESGFGVNNKGTFRF